MGNMRDNTEDPRLQAAIEHCRNLCAAAPYTTTLMEAAYKVQDVQLGDVISFLTVGSSVVVAHTVNLVSIGHEFIVAVPQRNWDDHPLLSSWGIGNHNAEECVWVAQEMRRNDRECLVLDNSAFPLMEKHGKNMFCQPEPSKTALRETLPVGKIISFGIEDEKKQVSAQLIHRNGKNLQAFVGFAWGMEHAFLPLPGALREVNRPQAIKGPQPNITEPREVASL